MLEGMPRIVVCSPSQMFCAMIDGIMCGSGVRMDYVGTADELFARCRAAAVDLVLVEGVRIFTDGTDAVRRIRRTGCSTPLIFVLAADESEDTVVALLKSGVNQYISLPADPLRLRHKLCGASAKKSYGEYL